MNLLVLAAEDELQRWITGVSSLLQAELHSDSARDEAKLCVQYRDGATWSFDEMETDAMTWDAVVLTPTSWVTFGARRPFVLAWLGHALAERRIYRVVVATKSTAEALSHVLDIARKIPLGLFVEDLDSAVDLLRLIRVGVSNKASSAAIPQTSEVAALLPKFESLPMRVGMALSLAHLAPFEWPVKRLVHECDITRRTLERTLKAAGLPSPAALLRTSRKALSRDR